MDPLREVAGFVGAWIEVIGPGLALLLLFIGLVRHFTRGRPARRVSGQSPAPHPSAYDDAYGAGGDFG